MGSRATPIDIGASSQHPYNHRQSAMSTALHQSSGNEGRPGTAMSSMSGMSMGSGYGRVGGHRDSLTAAAQPISMQSASNQYKPRRESLAGSMVTGMSWGGNSVGSWIRDDIIMQGTSPFAYQSPSFHSSSYQPKLEADFMRDFSCCNLKLPTLHDLLEHYEENHHQQIEEMQRRQSDEGPPPDPKAALASNAAAAVKDPAQAQHQQALRQRHQAMNTPQRSNTPTQSQHTPRSHQQNYAPIPVPQPSMGQDEDATVGDMEMDDDFSNQMAQYQMQQQPNMMQGNQFGQPAARAPPLDLSAVNGSNVHLHHQGLRNSSPNTPTSAGRTNAYYQNNPTVSSVNTPTLSAHPPGVHPLQQQQQFYTPESSAPGTPGELDTNFVDNMGHMNMGYLSHPPGYNPNPWGYQANNEMLDLCIDEPAKRLFTSNGGFSNTTQQQMPQPSTTSATQLGDGQYGENSELAKTIREQQKLAGVPDPSADGIPKPFHCPVIGCEKAYKNQNGLKYHKSHGHNTQTLHANPNGTFSIVDPETLQPFPGTLGMEKHKPYQCQTCGKRYKNLNGLKYHKAHSTGCDPEIKGLPSAMNSKRNSLEAKRDDADDGGSNEMILGQQ